MNPALLAVIGAILGGAVGSIITAGASVSQSRRITRENASTALWEYHRALAGFATRQYQQIGFGDEQAFFALGDFKGLRSAYEAAYPWAGFLRRPARDELFRRANITTGAIRPTIPTTSRRQRMRLRSWPIDWSAS